MELTKFEAWIQTAKGVRIVEVEAVDIRWAYLAAESMCQSGEYVRGVNPLVAEVAAVREP